MKKLILVRHAKSSWKDASLDDHDRPLNKRGERDAPHMGKVVKDKKVKPDLIVSSTALRAYSTAKEFAKKLDYPKSDILRMKELYLAELDGLTEIVKNLDDKDETVFLFGHNPGITWLANYLSGESVENVPTSGVFAMQFDIESWKEVAAGNGALSFFLYPKMYFKDAED